MIKFIFILILSIMSTNVWAQDQINAPETLPAGPPEPPFLENYSHLRDYMFNEPNSGLYFGFGVSPIGMLSDRVIFSINFFQLHYINSPWDIEIFNASYGFTRTGDSELQSNHFVFRTSPKYSVTKKISLGPLIGYEMVSFQNIEAKLRKGAHVTPEWEPFSSSGLIYGVMVSQTYLYKKDYLIRVNEVVYKQTYSTTKSEYDWSYWYRNDKLQSDSSRIEGAIVIAAELSILF
ncbi:MAG: hypothetical protein A2Z20_08390 [Bdellovibrionales bacterium RBG_16_40_8]|nr:MAG: hypothetical protein A2Z20_08390 [Bdellovibrionales bacterium RBG_16_40_8]